MTIAVLCIFQAEFSHQWSNGDYFPNNIYEDLVKNFEHHENFNKTVIELFEMSESR